VEKNGYALKVYQRPFLTRLELIVRDVESIKGSPRQIIERLEPERIVRRFRQYGVMAFFRDARFLQDMGIPGEVLRDLSQPVNGWDVHQIDL